MCQPRAGIAGAALGTRGQPPECLGGGGGVTEGGRIWHETSCCPREVTDALHLEEEKGGDSRGERGRCPRQREPRIHRPPPLRGCLCGKGLQVFAATWSPSCGSAFHVFPSQSLPASQEVGTLSAHLVGRTLSLRDVSSLVAEAWPRVTVCQPCTVPAVP